jgi:CheY-like chemotaxis protein
MMRRALVIEDNEQNAYMVRYLLEHAGFTVLLARDGPSGLAMAAGERPSVIILDIQLPGMDGYEVAGRLRTLPSLHGVPIVAVTSFAMTGDRDRALRSGCTAYLEKPIDPVTFVQSIEQSIEQSIGREGGTP